MAGARVRVGKDDVKLAKRLFYMGFALLPLVWLLNVVTFQFKYRKGVMAEDAPPMFSRCK